MNRMNQTRPQQLRFAIAREKEDLQRFELNPDNYEESIRTTKRIIERYEAELALYPPD
jgi:hypothetical protein